MTILLDANVLIAVVLEGHIHHERADRWLAGHPGRFATCSTTQGTLLRVHMQLAKERSPAAAWSVLQAVAGHPRHEFWDDGFPYTAVPHRHLQGPKQVTDAWLAELARRRGSRLATFDTALAALHDDVACLVPEDARGDGMGDGTG